MLEKILSVFKSPIDGASQKESEALVMLATFFYKVDRRVALEEQQYIEKFIEEVPWFSSLDVSTFQERLIAVVNSVLAAGEERSYEFLGEIMSLIETDDGRDRAKRIAREISDVDGEIGDLEVKFLEYVLTY